MNTEPVGQCIFGRGFRRQVIPYHISGNVTLEQARPYFDRIFRYINQCKEAEGPAHFNYVCIAGVEIR